MQQNSKVNRYNKNIKRDSEYQKSINRILYGLNKDVLQSESEEFKKYIEMVIM